MELWKKEIAVFTLFAVGLGLLLMFNVAKPDDSFATSGVVSMGERVIRVAVADSPARRMDGLSRVPSMPEDAGMLFIFETPSRYGFWMKEMRFPIDIIWMDELGKVVHVVPGALPSSYPEVFSPPADAKYVLEINAGVADKYGITEGVVLSIGGALAQD